MGRQESVGNRIAAFSLATVAIGATVFIGINSKSGSDAAVPLVDKTSESQHKFETKLVFIPDHTLENFIICSVLSKVAKQVYSEPDDVKTHESKYARDSMVLDLWRSKIEQFKPSEEDFVNWVSSLPSIQKLGEQGYKVASMRRCYDMIDAPEVVRDGFRIWGAQYVLQREVDQ